MGHPYTAIPCKDNQKPKFSQKSGELRIRVPRRSFKTNGEETLLFSKLVSFQLKTTDEADIIVEVITEVTAASFWRWVAVDKKNTWWEGNFLKYKLF